MQVIEAEALADLGGLTKPLQEKLAELEVVETRLTDELKVVRDAKRRVRKTLASLNGQPPRKSAAAPRGKKAPGGDTLRRVSSAVRKLGEGCTLSQIATEAGVHSTTARMAIDVLRERDEVRFMGQWRDKGAKNGAPANRFAPMGA